MKIPKQQYTAEFMELAVKGVNNGMTTGVAAKELGLGEQTLRNWAMAPAAGTSTLLEPRWSHWSRWMLLKGGFGAWRIVIAAL